LAAIDSPAVGTADPSRLAAENVRLAAWFVNRYYGRLSGDERAEATAAAMLGLVVAANRFDGRCGFVPFALWIIRNHVAKCRRAERRRGFRQCDPDELRLASLDAEAGLEGWTLAARLVADPEPDVDAAHDVARLLETLPERDAAMIRAIYLEQQEPKDVARRLGISKTRVYQILGRAMQTLRRRVGVPAA
jgi:RNA polymerase sigma factor (sigma-70 family)